MRLVFFIAIVLFSSCVVKQKIDKKTTSKYGTIIKRGLINCFPDGASDTSGILLNCEASAGVYYDKKILLATDKVVPNSTSVFTLSEEMPYDNQAVTYLTSPTLHKIRKIEDACITPNKKHVFMTSAFDRISSDGSLDAYNTLLYWKTGKEDQIVIPDANKRLGVESSYKLHEQLAKALATDSFPNGMPYFKVEGLMALPNNHLVFGIREIGANYNSYDYTITLIGMHYTFKEDKLVFKSPLKKLYSFDPSAIKDIKKPIGLSSLEYDPTTNQIYLLTSYEHGNEAMVNDDLLGAYIWTMTPEDIINNKAPILLRNAKKEPLHLAHKGEVITILNKNTLLIVHDDDRVTGRVNITDPSTQFYRQKHQAAYTIVRINQ